jgi:hypothetical protein
MIKVKLIRGILPTKIYRHAKLGPALKRARELADLHDAEVVWEGPEGDRSLVVDASDFYKDLDRVEY